MHVKLGAKPWLERQLPDAGPLLFWRPGPDETRDGMMWLVGACANPSCPCRDAHVEISAVDDRLLTVELEDGLVRRTERKVEGRAPVEPRRTAVRIDVDTGRVTPDPRRDSADDLLRWATEVLDARVRALLQRRFDEAKAREREVAVLDFDDETWSPGDFLAYTLVHPDGGIEVELDGTHYLADDQHCVTPHCDCAEMLVDFHSIDEPVGRAAHIGSVWVSVDSGIGLRFDAETANRALLSSLWERYLRGDPELQALRRRRDRMRAIAPELHRRAKPRAAPVRPISSKPGRNDPCPCGSGRKYKKCCLASQE